MIDRRAQFGFSAAITAVSALGLVKTLILAVLMPPVAFGLYAAFLGVTVIATIVLSFGRLERTTKSWPRAIEKNALGFFSGDLRAVLRKLAQRTALFAVLVAVCSAIAWGLGWIGPDYAVGGALAGTLTMPGIILLILASAFRATGSMRDLLAFTLARTLFVLLFVVPLAFWGGWQWALAGELIGQTLVAAAGTAALLRQFPRASSPGHEEFAESETADKDSRTLYFSSLAGALVPFGGRGFIAVVAGPAAAGAYAVAMMFVQVAQMFSSAIAQREGPAIIKSVERGEDSIVNRLMLPAALTIALAAAVWLAIVVSFRIPATQELWAGYGLNLAAFTAVAVAMMTTFHIQLYYALLAFDGERTILLAAGVSAAIAYCGFAVGAALGAPVAVLIAGAALGEAVRLAVLAAAFVRLRARERAG